MMTSIEAFTVDAAAQGMRIACVVGPRPDFTRLVIRYRTDGAIPSSPADGSALLDAPALPGATYRGWHHPLNRGFSYCYTVFGLDDRGSIRASATTCRFPPAAGGVNPAP